MKIIMKITIALICIFTLSIVVIGGCSLFKSKSKEDYRNSKDWKQINDSDAPWNNTNKLAEYWCHKTHSFMAAAPNYINYWTEENNSLVNSRIVAKEIDNYLLKSKLVRKWAYSGDSVNNLELKISPYRIFIVSVAPNIVIMIYGKNNYEITNQGIPSSILACYIESGTKLPYGNKIIAIDLSNNTRQEVTIPENEKTYTFKFDKCNIELTRDGDMWDTKRIDKGK